MADKTEMMDAIGKFDATKLKKTETKESNTLPTKESKCAMLLRDSCLLVFLRAHCSSGASPSLASLYPPLQPLSRRRLQVESCAIVVWK